MVKSAMNSFYMWCLLVQVPLTRMRGRDLLHYEDTMDAVYTEALPINGCLQTFHMHALLYPHPIKLNPKTLDARPDLENQVRKLFGGMPTLPAS